MGFSCYFPPCEHRRGGGVEGNCSAARAKVANEPQCRQAFAVQPRSVTLNGWNRRFAVDLSGACSRRWKSEFLSIYERPGRFCPGFFFDSYNIIGG